MADGPISICLIVEARADAEAARCLVDRSIAEAVDWIDEALLGSYRAWTGIEPGTDFSAWTTVSNLAREHRIQVLGHFDGKPGHPDSRSAAKALKLLAKFGFPDAVVFVRDADDQPERRAGLNQARSQTPDLPVVVGVAIPEREAWLLAGFIPTNDDERARLTQSRKRLGFDPTQRPQELRGEGKRSAKRALQELSLGDRTREADCLQTTALDALRHSGSKCGLADFLDEIDVRLLPLFRPLS